MSHEANLREALRLAQQTNRQADELARTLAGRLAAARAEGRKEGFEKAREMAALEGGNAVARWLGRSSPADGYVAESIRAMRDGEGK